MAAGSAALPPASAPGCRSGAGSNQWPVQASVPASFGASRGDAGEGSGGEVQDNERMFGSQGLCRPDATPTLRSDKPHPTPLPTDVGRGESRSREHIPYMSGPTRVVVIGGGVIGCAVAERLSLDRHQVTLLERDQLGAHASGAAAGELSPSGLPGDHESLAMFPE